MARRSVALWLVAIALLLLIMLAGWLHAWQPVAIDVRSPARWFLLILIILTAQVIVGYVLWALLNRRQRAIGQSEALHSIIHEFQTPIAAIRMAVDILDSPMGRHQVSLTGKYVRIIREETERLQQQVETMLTLARADRNTLTLNPEAICIQQLMHSVAERHGNYLHLHTTGVTSMLLADRLHLTNVLHNLLDNALKYSTGEPAIMVCTQMTSLGMSICVCDRGIGIPAHLLSQIFDPFFRIHNQSQASVKGFGLGLSYVQRIVQGHNWTIDVKSKPSQGSQFIIHIPPESLLPLQPGMGHRTVADGY